MAFWNIQGAPKQKIKKMEDQKTINKKAQIEIIEETISQLAGQQGVALMTICETNLTEDEKRRHSTLAKQINNYKEQQTASGMNQEDISKKNQYDLQIDQWNMNQEIKKILKNKNIKEIILKRKRKELPQLKKDLHTHYISLIIYLKNYIQIINNINLNHYILPI
ncbi:hypothetical protein ABPG72_021794 [Tetrahymena utriculariae]